jgi:hypothetical protein
VTPVDRTRPEPFTLPAEIKAADVAIWRRLDAPTGFPTAWARSSHVAGAAVSPRAETHARIPADRNRPLGGRM